MVKPTPLTELKAKVKETMSKYKSVILNLDLRNPISYNLTYGKMLEILKIKFLE